MLLGSNVIGDKPHDIFRKSTTSSKMSALKYIPVILLLMLYQLSTIQANLQSPDLNLPPPKLNNEDAKDKPDQCEACKLLVKSFEKGMDKTMRGKHEGGDTSWEEKNLKSYTDSEVRLVEIQEELCDDVDNGKAQCLAIAEESEQDVEDWWFKHRPNNVRLHDYLCVLKLKFCCLDGSFGPTCQPCPSHKCHGHGTCDGSGTRSGTGECICSAGYVSDECENCAENYYRQDITQVREGQQEQFTCLPCHKTCLGGCDGPASANCTECRPGYERHPETHSCNDINECELGSNEIDVGNRHLCPDGTYCVNTEGYYKCADCHRACSTCVGYGPDKCLSCAPDFFRDEDHSCIFTRSPYYDSPQSDDENLLDYILRLLMSPHKILVLVLLYPLSRALNGLLLRIAIVQPFLRISLVSWGSIMICRYLDKHLHWIVVTNLGLNEEMVARLESQSQSTSTGPQ